MPGNLPPPLPYGILMRDIRPPLRARIHPSPVIDHPRLVDDGGRRLRAPDFFRDLLDMLRHHEGHFDWDFAHQTLLILDTDWLRTIAGDEVNKQRRYTEDAEVDRLLDATWRARRGVGVLLRDLERCRARLGRGPSHRERDRGRGNMSRQCGVNDWLEPIKHHVYVCAAQVEEFEWLMTGYFDRETRRARRRRPIMTDG